MTMTVPWWAVAIFPVLCFAAGVMFVYVWHAIVNGVQKAARDWKYDRIRRRRTTDEFDDWRQSDDLRQYAQTGQNE